jgi:hypothetical protein
MKNRDEILTEAANGNVEALNFLRAFARRAHWVDDLADQDKSTDNPIALAQEEANWLLCLSSNAFFLAHRAQLVPAMILALNTWCDSHKFPAQQRDILKAQWHEVVWLVAWLTGGWNALRMVTTSHREFDFEVPIKAEKWTYTCEGCGNNGQVGQEFPVDGKKFCGIPCANAWKRKELNGLPR